MERELINRVVQADCLDHLSTLPPESVDFCLFSPPYDGIRDYGHNWAIDLSALGKQIFRVMKDRTITAVIIGDGTKDFAKSLTTARMQVDWVDNAGFRLFECCIYQRFGKPGAWWGTRFRVDSEFILLFLKGSRPGFFDKQHLMIPSKHAGKTWSGSDRRTDGTTIPVVDAPINDLKCRGTIWPYATSNSEGNRTKMKHPATFPDLLASDLIRCFCPPGGTTLDPLCGSGTTLVQAAKNGRDFLGIEINPEYVRIAEERLRTEAGVDLSEYCR